MKWVLLGLLVATPVFAAVGDRDFEDLRRRWGLANGRDEVALVWKDALRYAEDHPADTDGLSLAAELSYELGHFHEAEAYYSRVIELDAGYCRANARLGLLAFKFGRRGEAQRFLETEKAGCHSGIHNRGGHDIRELSQLLGLGG